MLIAVFDPRVVASSNPGLELANAFGVIGARFKLTLPSTQYFLHEFSSGETMIALKIRLDSFPLKVQTELCARR